MSISGISLSGRSSPALSVEEEESGRSSPASSVEEVELNDTELAQKAIDEFDLDALKQLPWNIVNDFRGKIADLIKLYEELERLTRTGYIQKEEPNWWESEPVKKCSMPQFKVQILSRIFLENLTKIDNLRECVEEARFEGDLEEFLKKRKWSRASLHKLKSCDEDEFQKTLAYLAMKECDLNSCKLLSNETLAELVEEVHRRQKILEEIQKITLVGPALREALDKVSTNHIPQDLVDLMIEYV